MSGRKNGTFLFRHGTMRAPKYKDAAYYWFLWSSHSLYNKDFTPRIVSKTTSVFSEPSPSSPPSMDNPPGIRRRKVFCIIDCNSPSSLRDCIKPSSFAALEWPNKGWITSPSISAETPIILDNKSARLPFKIDAKGYIIENRLVSLITITVNL